MIRRGTDDQLSEPPITPTIRNGRAQAAFGAIGVAHVYQIAEPTLERIRIHIVCLERSEQDSWGLASAVDGDARQSMEVRANATPA